MCHNVWMNRSRMLGACAASALLMVLSSTARAQSCKQVIADQAALVEHTQLTVLQQCEDQKRSGTLPAITDCLAINKKKGKFIGPIAKAIAAATKAVSKACKSASLASIGFASDGSAGNPILAKACLSTSQTPGGACELETECPGICVGSDKNNDACTFNSSCANHICQKGNCIGGKNPGTPCPGRATELQVCGKDAMGNIGFCPTLESQAPPGAGNIGFCNGGTNNQGGCGANSDCPGTQADGTTPAFCDAGCNTGNLLDSQSGICHQALCGTNKDCGLCTNAASPFHNQSCASDNDCGKVCTDGTAPGAACKVAATDCPGGGTCAAIPSSCATGTCSGGFCSSGDPFARASSGLCQPTPRCPNFKNDKLPVATCNGGSAKKNGSVCNTDKDCGKVKGVQIKCEQGCGFPLTSATDAGNCAICLAGAAATNLNGLFFGDLTAKSSDAGLETCKTAVGDAGATFADAKRTALKTCEDTVLAGSGSCPDATATSAINTARTALTTAITSACSGFTAEQIATIFTCPAVTVPGAATSCAGPTNRGDISTVADLANCVACVADFSTSCTDRLSAPAAGAPFPECNPRCGNGKIDGRCSNDSTKMCISTLDCVSPGTCVPFETCDDSNSEGGDTCPGNCSVALCSPTGSKKTVSVTFNSPTPLGALSVFVTYPDGVVSIPGLGTSTDTSRFTADPSLIVTPNDLDYAARVALLSGGGSISSPAFSMVMDTCTGAGAPTAGQFRCHVESASDTSQNVVTGVTCAVSVL